MSSVRAYLELARWPNALMAAGGVLLGGLLVTGGSLGPYTVPVVLACASAIALTVVANAWNDAADAAIDRIAHPARPVPSGRISQGSASLLALSAAALGIVLAALAAPALGALSVLVVILMLAYSPWLKRRGLSGNVTAALLGSLPFYYGMLAAGSPQFAGYVVAWIFTLQFAREIAKDIDDAAADAGHRDTVPLRWGLRVARGIALVAIVLFVAPIAIVSIFLPKILLLLGPALICIAVGAGHIVSLRAGAPRALKAAMLLGMLAVAAVIIFPHLERFLT